MVELDEDSGEILLVGGDSDAAEMYQMKLVLDGYRVITVADIGDAAARPRGWKPDIVLIDLGAGSGAPLLELTRLRADPNFAALPTILLSTHSEEELRKLGVALGPMDYVLRTDKGPHPALPRKRGRDMSCQLEWPTPAPPSTTCQADQ